LPSVKYNKALWDADYGWSEAGDEWSAPWGSVAMQWRGTILPRIQRFLPAGTILEIACGHGRWTQYLQEQCDELTAVDLSPTAVDACRKKFAGCPHVKFAVTDGKSLDMVADQSIDFIFSFDSLVHADESILNAYLGQFARILKKDGAAFIHHSNSAEFSRFTNIQTTSRVRYLLHRLHLLENPHLRDFSVSAEKVQRMAQDHGLTCIGQEINTWLTRHTLIDCFSTIVRQGSSLARDNVVIRNTAFSQEIRNLSRLSGIYG
jgi:ubiquinone/menaquinone biosynthesis C-methylase UbiE